MGHGRNEIVLHAIQFLQTGIGLPQFRRGAGQLQRLLFKLPRVGPHLRRFIEDVHHLVNAERLFGYHRRHHRARRRRADGAGQQGFGKAHQARVGWQILDAAQTALPGVSGEGFLRAFESEKPPGQRQQIGHPGTAAPARGACRLGAADKQRRLSRLAHIGHPLQGNADVGAQIHQQAPHQTMGNLVEPGQAEQVLRTQQFDAEQTLGDKAVGQPARLGERRQQQGIGPQHEARRQTGQCAIPRAALPEQTADHHRRKLRYRGKGDQSDRHQRIGFSGDAEIQIAETENHGNGPASDFQQQPREVCARGQTQHRQAQQQRHHEVVADHGRQGDGFDDDHAGGRRQASNIDKQRQALLLMRHRQGQDECIGVNPGTLEMHQARQRHRQYEQIDQEQVEREHPHRAPQMAGIDVFHHRDLKLAWQQQRGEQREEYQCAPGAVGGRRVGGGETARNFGHLRRLREYVADAVVDAPDDEDADRQEGDKLDHRLDGDRRHHSLMAFGGVQMTGAEQDRKSRQNHCYIQRAVLKQGHGPRRGRHDDVRVTGKNRKTVRHRLELQRDVGNHPDHGDHRHQAAQQLALAIA